MNLINHSLHRFIFFKVSASPSCHTRTVPWVFSSTLISWNRLVVQWIRPCCITLTGVGFIPLLRNLIQRDGQHELYLLREMPQPPMSFIMLWEIHYHIVNM